MRLLHTSDWHLGHVLHGVSREREHREFLRWLVATLADEAIDVLLVTGDVFDSATPSASAEAAWFDFLAEARRVRPDMSVVVIAGNHDSPSRLGAPASLLRRLGVHIIGQVPRLARDAGGGVDVARLLIPVANGRGLVAAVPFLRAIDLSARVGVRGPARGELDALAEDDRAGAVAADEVAVDKADIVAVDKADIVAVDSAKAASATAGDAKAASATADDAKAGDASADDAEGGPAAIYREVAEAARRQLGADQAFIVTGHLYVTGAEPSWLSERRIAIGGQEALPPSVFPPDASYVALGHLHRAQRVLAEHVRYAGAPIPLAMVEAGYRHQVVVVDFEGARAAQIRALEVPRTVEILRVPRLGAAALDDVLGELAELPELGERGEADPTRPLLEVVVALSRPEPRLRATIEAALEGKAARLIRLGVEGTGDGAALGDHRRGEQLAEVEPTEVFERCWHRRYGDAPSPAIRGAFQRLLDEVRGGAEERTPS